MHRLNIFLSCFGHSGWAGSLFFLCWSVVLTLTLVINKFVCRDDAGGNPLATITAGSQTNIKWSLTALHVGDCFLYLTYDLALPDTQKRWFKIAQWLDCKAYNGQDVPVNIPSYLPACTHCIMRWEWYALHLYPGSVEYYTQCVDVAINGAATGSLPTPQVTIPGHLPTAPTAYRDPWTAGAPQFFTGPALASLGGAPSPSSTVAPPSSSSVIPASSSTPPPSSSTRQQTSRSQTQASSSEESQMASSSPSLPVPPSSTTPTPSTPSTEPSVSTTAAQSDSVGGASAVCIEKCKDACAPSSVTSCRCYGDDITVDCNGSAAVNIRSLLLAIFAALLFCCKLL